MSTHINSPSPTPELFPLPRDESSSIVKESLEPAVISDLQEKEFKPYRYRAISEKGILSEREFAIFQEIFSTLAKSSYWQLLANKHKIDSLKIQVAHIHPFNCLQALKSNPILKEAFLTASNKWAVWSQCKASFKEEITRQHKFENIFPHITDFSEKMNLDLEQITGYLSAGKIDSLMKYILQENA